MEWTPSSWRGLPIKQQPEYKDQKKLEQCIDKIRRLPPLVATTEINSLRNLLKECAQGKRFLLQGGDCAEQFEECELKTIANKVKILLQMSFVLTYGAQIPTVRIGRLAGQYSKPRSSDLETIIEKDGTSRLIKSYRGDNVNSFEADDKLREADPERLIQGYFHSVATLNGAKVALAEGLADLRQAKFWDMDFIQNKQRKDLNNEMSKRILSALKFMETIGLDLDPVLKSVDLFVSHEGLHLDYEEAMTTKVDMNYYNFHYDDKTSTQANGKNGESQMSPPDPKRRRKISFVADDEDDIATPGKRDESSFGYYNTGAHFIWIGDRTRGLNDAHIEYFRGIKNPIGMKVGPSMNPDELIALLDKLDPNHEPGRVTLITRFGCQNVAAKLPALIRAVKNANFEVVWCCDPMHGNTKTVDTKDASGEVVKFKTREYDDVLMEIEECVKAHKKEGSFLAGVHFELTGDNVTECTGGPENLVEQDLPTRYNTFCDPRLNYAQSIEVAFRLAEYLLNR